MRLIYMAGYDGFTRDGTSKDVRVPHVGGERWYAEIYPVFLYVRLGPIDFQFGFGWAEDVGGGR